MIMVWILGMSGLDLDCSNNLKMYRLDFPHITLDLDKNWGNFYKEYKKILGG